jgi:hypothetical protein
MCSPGKAADLKEVKTTVLVNAYTTNTFQVFKSYFEL